MSDEIPDYTQESFKLEFEKKNVKTYVVINTEMFSEEDGLDFTGKYLVYYLHPAIGSVSSKIVKEYEDWKLFEGPNIIKDMVPRVGSKIDERKKVK